VIKYTPRPYQEETEKSIALYLNDSKRKKPEIVVAPTASGKSLLIAMTANLWNGKVLVLQPSQELLEQNLEKFESYGEKAGVYCSGLGRKELKSRVVFATVQSISNIPQQALAAGFTLLLIDECHYKFSPDPKSEFMRFVSVLKPTKSLGFTATPFRLESTLDGSVLKLLTRSRPNYFKDFAHIIQIQDIIQQGFWSRLEYEKHIFDNSYLLLNSTGSDFTESSVKTAITIQEVPRKIYKDVKRKLANGYRSILVFCDSVETATTLQKHTDKSAILTAETKKGERADTLKKFKSGKINVLYNVGILTTGFDFPALQCVIMGRPTNSLALWYQIVGRGTRLFEGKEFCTIVDYCGNLDRFGPVEHLTLEYIEGWGWGICSGERVLTNVLMGAAPKTKSSIVNKNVDIETIWFGSKKGTPVEELPIWYINFLLDKSGIFDGSNDKMNRLRSRLTELREKIQKVS